MQAKDRRETILNKLIISNVPLKGQDLAKELGVTRQIIVKDIALLRASGSDIIATPDGYIMKVEHNNLLRKIIPVVHTQDDIHDELMTIIKYGAIVEDIIISHNIYGEIKCNLMIKTIIDIENLISKFKNNNVEPLLTISSGVHLHTVLVSSEEVYQNIVRELKDKKYYLEVKE